MFAQKIPAPANAVLCVIPFLTVGYVRVFALASPTAMFLPPLQG